MTDSRYRCPGIDRAHLTARPLDGLTPALCPDCRMELDRDPVKRDRFRKLMETTNR